MDAQSYNIQWIRHSSGDMKTTRQLIISDQPPVDEHDLITNRTGNGLDGHHNHQDYLVHEVDTEEDIDQIAAENLIFMAHDGQMVAEIINASREANTVVVGASDGTAIDCALLEASTTGDCGNGMEEQEISANGSNLEQFNEEYAETQMVTEEIITDDWVQRQGEERVEIPAEQIICSRSLGPLDNEVPLPTVQDEYTALRPYPCDFCSRRFRKKTSLMNHMVAHQNDRPHLCKLCGSRFFRRCDLINHLKAHAETPDPEFDDVEFMNFVEQTAIDQQQQQQQQQQHAKDHYYDQDWNIQSNPATKKNKPKRKSNSAIPSGNSSSSSHTSRARASRIKPKEEYNYTIDETLRQNREGGDPTHVPQLNYGECNKLETSTDALKLVQADGRPKQFPVTDENKPFVCQECGLSFAREKALKSHVKGHRMDSPYECTQCNEMFWDSSSLQDHLKTHQFEDSNSEYEPADAEETQTDSEAEYLYGEFYCSSCGMSFHRQDLLKRHGKVHVKKEEDNDKDRHCCTTCGETFAEALDLLAHAEIHARYPPFKCVLCGESFFEETTIKRHLNVIHSNEMTVNSCILCGKQCRDRKALMKHAWDHSREKCHSCSKCGKNFHNKARLKRHMASHRDKSVTCEVCHEEFSDGRTLSNHRHSHSATASGKLFPCNECGKTFGSRSSQQIHVRIHTGERPYGCRYCWKAFADGGTLRKHERIHTGEKPYACSVCPRAFNQRVVLREHIRTHHSGLDTTRGTYYCSVCSAEMNSSTDLIQHLIQHSDSNTALQRQPITGPRKYKRRRKLKPHEIAHLRSEHKANRSANVAGSDIDISDFDMENVEDFLGIPEAPSGASNAATAKQHKKQDAFMAEHVTGGNSSSLEQVHASSSVQQIDATPYAKERYNSTGSNSDSKLSSWQNKLMNSNSNEETYKSLLSNLENTLQNIDTLVVGNEDNDNNVPQSNEERYHTEQQLNEVKAEPHSGSIAQQSASTAARVRSNKKVVNKKLNKSPRPRMIHTERIHPRSAADSGGTKRRTKKSITRTGTKMELLAKRVPTDNSLTNDYDMILQDMQSPHKTTSCPAGSIKQEHNNSQNQNNIVNTQNQRDNDLYDAQLLLEATSLRKEMYEKYNPNIVNDLEEMLRSPDKSSDKSRHRFTSESSTANYLVDQSEEEQHLIKIEPTSPNIHDIVAEDGNASERQKRRRPPSNRKYLEFATEMSSLTCNRTSSATKPKSHRVANKLSKPNSADCTKNYMKYLSQAYQTIAANANNASSSSAGVVDSSISPGFASVSAVEATAANAASSSSNSARERKQRFYECEMCSAVFSDRAQLLDHVPIHI